LDEHELAWAAGFFDGDGWAALVRSRGRKRGQPHAQINQASLDGVPDVLRRFRNAVGVGRISGPKIEDGRQPLYWWVASSARDVARAGSLIGPWLSPEKRRQFENTVALSFGYPPRDSIAWAAGLFDAEGSASLSDHRSHAGYKVIEASITQGGSEDVPVELQRFLALVATGRNYGPYEQEDANEPIYRWRSYTTESVRGVVHLLLPRLGEVKRKQALTALAVVDSQPTLPRGRAEWGSHKTHCIHGHEYAAARLKPYARRTPNGIERRASKQCLACVREQARMTYLARKRKIGGDPAADLDSPQL